MKITRGESTQRKRETPNTQVSFGLHVMIDAYGCDPKVLDSPRKLYAFLDETPGLLGMRKLSAPHLIHAEGNNVHDPGGWTGVVLIAESHISLHTFVKRQFVTLDIYSCKHFNSDFIIERARKFFKTTDMDVFTQERGLRYPNKNLL